MLSLWEDWTGQVLCSIDIHRNISYLACASFNVTDILSIKRWGSIILPVNLSGGLLIIAGLLCLVTQSCLTLCDPMDCSPASSSVHGDSPGKNTGVGCHAILQGIFLTQGSNPGLPHFRQILYHLSHQGGWFI